MQELVSTKTEAPSSLALTGHGLYGGPDRHETETLRDPQRYSDSAVSVWLRGGAMLAMVSTAMLPEAFKGSSARNSKLPNWRAAPVHRTASNTDIVSHDLNGPRCWRQGRAALRPGFRCLGFPLSLSPTSHAVLWPLQAFLYGLPAWATASAVHSRWQKELSE